MIAELDSITEPEFLTSSWQFAQLDDYIVDMFLHAKPLVGLKFLLATKWFASKSTTEPFYFSHRRK
jgi:hypothetical protein